MLDSLAIGASIFIVILAGALGGSALGRYLPPHHLSDETRTHVSVSMAVVATISALVLGLLISSANTSFIGRSGEVTALSADILRLDQMLRHYGPEAEPARQVLRQYAERKSADLFPESPRDQANIANPATYELLFRVEMMLLGLEPADARQKWMMGQATTLAANIGNTRWLLAQRSGPGTPKVFLGLVVFWLTLLFASFGLFAPRNLTSVLALILCAIAVAGAVEMVLELEQPFGGLIRISPEPLRHAVQVMSL